MNKVREELSYKPEDFNECLFNFFDGDHNLNPFYYAESKGIKLPKEFHVEIKIHKKDTPDNSGVLSPLSIMRYIQAVYDPKSPISKIVDMSTRKVKGAVMARWETADDHFPKQVDAIIQGRNKDINLMAIRYLRYFMDEDYTTLIVLKEAYYNILAAMMTTTEKLSDAGNKASLVVKINAMRIEIQKLELSVLSQDKSLQKDLLFVSDYLDDDIGIMPEAQ